MNKSKSVYPVYNFRIIILVLTIFDANIVFASVGNNEIEIFHNIMLIVLFSLIVLLSLAYILLFLKYQKNKKATKISVIKDDLQSINGSELFKSLNAANIGIVRYDVVDNIFYRDKRFYEYLGYDADDLKKFGTKLFSIIYEDDIKLVRDYHNNHKNINSDIFYRFKFRVYRKDRSLATLLFLGETTEFTEENLPKMIHGVFVDISNMEKLQSDNQRLEELLKLVLSEYGVSTWEWCRGSDKISYQLLSENEELDPLIQKIFNKEGDNYVIDLKTYYDIVHPDDINELVRFAQNYIAAADGKRVKTAYNQHKIIINNTIYTIYIRCKVIEYGEDGTANKVLGIAHNITDRINEYEAKSQSLKLEAIGSLAAGVAHDFNNQLNGILGFTDLLQRSDELKNNTFVHRYLQLIKDCGEKCEEFTAQLLSFAQKGREKLELFSIDLVLNNIVKMLEHTIDRSINIRLIFNAVNHIIQGDKSQIESIIINILLNSCDAITGSGEIVIETDGNINNYIDSIHSFRKYADKDIIVIKITDNGRGMNKEILDKVFEPFFTTKDNKNSSGMGLSIAFGIIKQHSGEIYIDSMEGKGTTVYICLPVNNNTLVFDNDIKQSEMDNADYNSKLFGKILVVDDEMAVRVLLKNYLTSFGCETILAVDGVDAISKYKKMKDQISLVISDISMPKMNGIETLKNLKKINPEVKVILITGYAENDDKVTYMLEHGAMALLKKPLNREKLYSGIRKALNQ